MRAWLDDSGRFLFGKYGPARSTIRNEPGDQVIDVAKRDPSYLRWVLENVDDMDDEDRKVIEVALEHFGGRRR
jgi:hypothetical protein